MAHSCGPTVVVSNDQMMHHISVCVQDISIHCTSSYGPKKTICSCYDPCKYKAYSSMLGSGSTICFTQSHWSTVYSSTAMYNKSATLYLCNLAHTQCESVTRDQIGLNSFILQVKALRE